MSIFADSSALVKIYADEEGSDLIRNLDVVAVSQIARVQIPAALWRKQRLGEFSAFDHALRLAAAIEGFDLLPS